VIVKEAFMQYYIDISLLPDAEANLGFLWQKLFQQVHLALVEKKLPNNTSAIAASFPHYGDKVFPLGNKLRLLAEKQEQLQQLDIGKWLNRLTDYTHYTSIKEVPFSVNQYVYFERKQFDTNIQRIAKRRSQRKGETLEQALNHLKEFSDTETRLPFINMKSLTKGNHFRLFIEKTISDESQQGGFGCYGLSKGGNVPWF